jgi:hypothetical protein
LKSEKGMTQRAREFQKKALKEKDSRKNAFDL